MVSYIVETVSTFILGEEDDDPSCLKDPSIMAVYENPYKALGVNMNAQPWEVRDAFRNNCLNLLCELSDKSKATYFNKLEKPRLPFKHSMIAFHLIAKTLKVKRAQHLKQYLDEHPSYFTGEAQDMLHTLRPIHCAGIPMVPTVRACANLQLVYETYTLLCSEDADVIPHQKYSIRVVYCARVHFINRRYSDFLALYAAISKELLMVPGFPAQDLRFKIGLGEYDKRGEALCAFANRVHNSLACRGVFSPRLLEFLEVDAARVHIEEDGRISKKLDSVVPISGSAWHMVEEGWLKRWRKFVLGRAARRYEPPGPITNELLLIPRSEDLAAAELEEDRPSDRASTLPIVTTRRARRTFPARMDDEEDGMPGEPEPVEIGKHYRAVNFNLWSYWMMVHGGGPCISRKTKDIHSHLACGAGMQCRLVMQRFARMCIAKGQRLQKYWKHLSRTAPGVREVLAEYEEQRIKDNADHVIKAKRAERTSSKMGEATQYTQRMWRAKKQYAFNDDNVRVMKHAQEIFAMADGEVEHATAGAAFVVEEGESVMKFGGVDTFDIKFTVDDGPSLPLVLKKHSCSELTFIYDVLPRLKKGTNREFLLPPSERPGEPEPRGKDAVLTVVSNYPVSALTHKQVMHRLMTAKWPLTLRFEKTLDDSDVKSLAEMLRHAADAAAGGPLPPLDDDMKLQMLKRLLHRGLPLVRHWPTGRPYMTMLYANERIFFWNLASAARSKRMTPKLSLKYDLTRAAPIYELKYLRVGKVSKTFRSTEQMGALSRLLSKKVDAGRCFTLFGDNRTLDFELPLIDDDPVKTKEARNLLCWGIDSIIREAHATQIFVDKIGAPIRRKEPKTRLRVVNN